MPREMTTAAVEPDAADATVAVTPPHPRGPDTRPWLLVSAAFVTTGGQDRANYALAAHLARQQRSVHLVTHRVADDLQPADTIVTHRAPRPQQSDLLGEPFLQRMGARCASHLRDAHVVANGGNCAWPDVNWVHYVHAAYTPDGRSGTLRRWKQQLAHRLFLRDERRSLRAARIVIANSRRTARDLVERVGVAPARIRVVYYGNDSNEFRLPDAGERADTRRRLGWPADRPVALFIGALGDQRKGFDTLYTAWQRLARISRFQPLLVVIGRGAMLSAWRTQAAADGLDGSMIFLGFRDDVPALVRAADLLIAPTRYEAYGLGVHEALCCGLPALVSADAGVAERYPPSLSHLLIPDVENAGDLAERIDACLDSHDTLTRQMQPFAASLGARTWDDMARDIVAAVES